MDERTVARFLGKVNKNGPIPARRPDLGPCWIWKPVPGTGGYGQFYIEGRPQLAHRASYKLFVRPIPPGLTIDHLCKVRACVRPEHLEAVTLAVNLQRSETWKNAGGGAWNRGKTHCPKGHPYSGDNLRVGKNGKRACRACHREWQAKRRERLRAENPPSPPAPREWCANGHSWAEFGIVRNSHQICLQCEREKVRRSRAKRKAEQGPKPAKLACKHGHPWVEENIYTDPKGRKSCRACHNAATLARYYEQKTAAPPKPPRETCAHGHAWIPENLYVTPGGHEKCRECARERNRRYEAHRKAGVSV